MVDAESPTLAIKEGCKYKPLDDDVNWGDGDYEMADDALVDAAQGDDQVSSSSTQRDIKPPKVSAPGADKDDKPLTDLDDPEVAPTAPEQPTIPVPDAGTTVVHGPGPLTGAIKRGNRAAGTNKGKRNAAAKNAGNADPSTVKGAPKMATHATARLSKAACG
ncbi:hypothetical protein RhiJN_24373 [Ceratobasidium sp. AG-Ba]|nr:hypothetical protein RhiJN_24373 [Ceratobasidium sp. AG-Ba]